MTDKQKSDKVQGEGDYDAGRRFQKAERSFVKNGPVDEKAREAADALDGPEGADLEAARKATENGEIHPHSKPADSAGMMADESDRPTNKTLDRALKDTFPASDPAPISPGAD